MSRSSRPNLVAEHRAGPVWDVHDANGSGRWYVVTVANGKAVTVHSRHSGRPEKALDPNGRTAEELIRTISAAVDRRRSLAVASQQRADARTNSLPATSKH